MTVEDSLYLRQRFAVFIAFFHRLSVIITILFLVPSMLRKIVSLWVLSPGLFIGPFCDGYHPFSGANFDQ